MLFLFPCHSWGVVWFEVSPLAVGRERPVVRPVESIACWGLPFQDHFGRYVFVLGMGILVSALANFLRMLLLLL